MSYTLTIDSAVLGCTKEQFLTDESYRSCLLVVVQDMDGGVYLYAYGNTPYETLRTALNWKENCHLVMLSDDFDNLLGADFLNKSDWQGNIQDPVFSAMAKDLIFLSK